MLNNLFRLPKKKKKPQKFHRLALKLLLAIVIWSVFILSFVSSTVAVTFRMENYGLAISEAGNLSKYIYRISAISFTKNNQALIQEQEDKFIKTLNKINTLNVYLPFQKNKKNIFQTRLNQINEDFIVFQAAVKQVQNNQIQQDALLQKTQKLNHKLENFTHWAEKENSQNIHLLRKTRAFLLSIIILSAVLSFYLLQRFILSPLKTINNGINAIAVGQWHTRTQVASNDEFRLLSDGFNSMAEHLEKTYNNLENQVTKTTSELNHSNHNWALLYEMTSYLHQKSAQNSVVNDFLYRLIEVVQADGGCVHLSDKQSQITTLCQYNIPHSSLLSITEELKNKKIWEKPYSILNHGTQCLLHFPMHYGNHFLGVLHLLFNKPKTISPIDQHLVQSLSAQLGVTIKNLRLQEQEKQLAVLEERNLMAQGLHDNIAQSLSFLNLQAQMQVKAIDQQQWHKAHKNAGFIQEGVQRCYEDVRELLSNFKKPATPQNFMQQAHKLLARYREQLKIAIHFSATKEPLLSMEQTQQVVFILQEALSNIRKHAKASCISVSLSEQQGFCMIIEDNGQGFDCAKLNCQQDGQQIGLQIMRERSEKISAQLTIESTIGKGSTICLLLSQKKEALCA